MKEMVLVMAGLVMGLAFGYGILIFNLNRIDARISVVLNTISQLSNVISLWQKPKS